MKGPEFVKKLGGQMKKTKAKSKKMKHQPKRK
jgi:hypothetical protein